MRLWISCRSSVFAGLRGHRPRLYSAVAGNVERVSISNGSLGDVTIDLHNIEKLSRKTPLMVYLPPFSTAFTDTPVKLPRFIRQQPTAVVNYRWAGFSPFQAKGVNAPASTGASDEGELLPPMSWPTPIQDTILAYDWIVQNLGPPEHTRRDIYLYGSYLGASMAMSIALTETQPHQRMAVRGCIAFNGIYNWTTFLPDHELQKKQITNPYRIPKTILTHKNDFHFRQLERHAEALFVNPNGLFDPFASPCLFFLSPGLLVPPNFTMSALSPEASLLANIPLKKTSTGKSEVILQHPRETRLLFPPNNSTLKIPETLLLYTQQPPPPPPLLKMPWEPEEKAYFWDSFHTQADRLCTYMRSSIDKSELVGRFKWDDNRDRWLEEAQRRIRIHNVGTTVRDYTLPCEGEKLAATWLEDHMS